MFTLPLVVRSKNGLAELSIPVNCVIVTVFSVDFESSQFKFQSSAYLNTAVRRRYSLVW